MGRLSPASARRRSRCPLWAVPAACCGPCSGRRPRAMASPARLAGLRARSPADGSRQHEPAVGLPCGTRRGRRNPHNSRCDARDIALRNRPHRSLARRRTARRGSEPRRFHSGERLVDSHLVAAYRGDVLGDSAVLHHDRARRPSLRAGLWRPSDGRTWAGHRRSSLRSQNRVTLGCGRMPGSMALTGQGRLAPLGGTGL